MEYHGAPASWINSHNDLAISQDYEIPEVQLASIPQQKVEASIEVAERTVPISEDRSRQTGDVTTWIYYGKSIGGLLIVSAVSLVVAAVVSQNFQGTIVPSSCLLCKDGVDTIGRYMAANEYWTIP